MLCVTITACVVKDAAVIFNLEGQFIWVWANNCYILIRPS